MKIATHYFDKNILSENQYLMDLFINTEIIYIYLTNYLGYYLYVYNLSTSNLLSRLIL